MFKNSKKRIAKSNLDRILIWDYLCTINLRKKAKKRATKFILQGQNVVRRIERKFTILTYKTTPRTNTLFFYF
jgi:hypothetical protein